MSQQETEWPELAIAIVPYQRYGKTYNIKEALEKGTIFPALYHPYDPGKGWGSL